MRRALEQIAASTRAQHARAAFVTAMLVCNVASATAVREIALAQLAQRAELIVEVDAGAAQSFRVDGRIFTRTTMQVRAAWKGPQTRDVSIVTRGGIEGGVGQRVDGETVLPSGTHAVLFLVYDEHLEGYRTVALEQGAYVIADTRAEPPPPGMLATRARLQASDVASFARQVKSYVR